jgi:hypothetical protein
MREVKPESVLVQFTYMRIAVGKHEAPNTELEVDHDRPWLGVPVVKCTG